MKPSGIPIEHPDAGDEKGNQEWRDGDDVMGQDDQMVALAAQ